MYERFTDRARQVMQIAKTEAERLNHEYIGAEHILLGIVTAGPGVAVQVLQRLGIEPSQIQAGIAQLAPPRPAPLAVEPPPQSSPAKKLWAFAARIWKSPPRRPYRPRVRKVIEYAMEETRGFGHNYVGTEHILLGLLKENESTAAEVLRNLGLHVDALREETLRTLSRPN